MRPTPTRHLRDCMPKLAVRGPFRRLAIVLGDQLNRDANALKGLDKSRDLPSRLHYGV